MSDQVVTLRINADGSVAVTAVEQVAAATRKMGTEAQQGGRAAAQGMAATGNAARSLAGDAGHAKTAVTALVAAAGSLSAMGLARGLMSAADSWSDMTSRIRVNIGASEDAGAVMARLASIARSTYSSIEATADSYARNAVTLRALGKSTAQQLDYTEALNNALVVSGAKGEMFESVQNALGKAMATGSLRGIELNAVLTSGSRVAEALAKELGTTVVGLRDMGEEGKITSDLIFNTLTKNMQTFRTEAESMPSTIGDAFTLLRNAVLETVGVLDQQHEVSESLALSLIDIADNMGLVITMAAGIAGSVVVAHAAAAAAAVLQDMAQRKVAASALVEAQAQVAKIRAMQVLTPNVVALTAAEHQLAAAQAAANAAGVGRAGVLARMGSGMLALAGGPVGVAVLALGALGTVIYSLHQREQERIAQFQKGIATTEKTSASVAELADQIERAAQGYGALPDVAATVAKWSEATQELIGKQTELAAKRGEIEALESRIQAVQQSTSEGAGVALLALVPKLQQVQGEYAALEGVINSLAGALDRLDFDKFFNPTAAQVAGDQAGQAFAQLSAGAKSAEQQIEKNKQGQIAYWQALAQTRIEQARASGASDTAVKGLQAENDAMLKTIASTLKKPEAVRAARDAAADYVANLQKQVATYGLSAAATARYELSLQKLTPTQRKLASAAIDTLEELERLTKAFKPANDAVDELAKGSATLDEELAKGRDILAGLDDAQVQYNASLREANQLYNEALALGPPTAAMQAAEEERLRKIAELRDQKVSIAAHQESTRAALEAEREQLRKSQEMWGNYADAVFDAVSRSGNFLKNLLGNLKQVVTQMLAEWFRTRVIGMFTGGGGGFGGLAMGAAGQMMGMGSSAAAAGAGGGFNFMSPSSWAAAGKSLWGGFAGAGAGAAGIGGGSTMFGSYYGSGFVGPLPAGAQVGFAPSALGYGAAAAGGAYAGYQRYRNSEGGVAGLAGGAAYGIGTAAVGLGAMGAMASGSIAGGIAGMSALGPIGWIAAAAMVVDMISGGKLFGTAFRAESASQSIGLSAGGATAGLTRTDVRERALFSGREWRDVAMDVPPELREAAERFYKSIEKVMVDGARRLSIDTPPMIDAAIRTVSEYNKKGEVTATKYFVDALGRTWEEASAELAATRVSAEAIVATVAASEAGRAASQIAEQWRDSAEMLLDGAQMMLAATADIAKGQGLLSHGSGLAAGGLLPSDPDVGTGAAGSGGGRGPGQRYSETMLKSADGAAAASDELARTVALVQELSHAGESLSDAYARLIADTTLLQQAVDLMGVTLDKSAEDFVRFAAGIEEAAGGLEAANALWQSYFTNYYSAQEMALTRLTALQEQSATSLAAVGLDTASSMEDFRAAFEAALPTLSPEEVVEWLRAGDALAQLTGAMSDLLTQAYGVLDSMGLATGGLSLFGQTLVGLKQQEQMAIDAANAIAKAQGREGASSIQLAKIHDWAAKQIAAALRQLQAETRDLIAKLYGGMPGTLDGINERIAELEGATGGWSDSIDRVSAASDNLFARWAQGVETVQQYLDSMLLGDLSGLSEEEKLSEAQRQLIAMQQAAAGGDADALARLPQLADAYLRLARGSFASGEDFNAQSDWVRQLLQSVVDMPNPGVAPGAEGALPGGGETVVVASPELQALYAARDAALAAQEVEHRAALAQTLLEHMADWATLVKVPVLDLIAAQGLSLEALATDLGVNLDDLNARSVEALGNMALTLGLSMTELTGALGITLTDLAGGLTELTASVGIDLSNLTTESTQSLAALAGSLGMDLSELATAVGVDLGSLADAQSLLNKALAGEIQGLPGDQRDALEPLLAAISTATSEADANAAIAALEDAVNLMAPDIRTQLAPYLANVFPASALSDLDYLGDIQRIAADQLGVLGDIAKYLKDANHHGDVPGYAVGSSYIPRDHLAMVHQGEGIVDANSWRVLQQYGIRLTAPAANDGGATVREIRALREEVAALRRENAAGHRSTADAVTTTEQKAYNQRDEIQRKTASNGGRGN